MLSGQKQIGCLEESQIAPNPHGFGSQILTGSTQPRIVLGLSIYPDKQVHFENPLLKTAHCVLGPHGDGLQGCVGS